MVTTLKIVVLTNEYETPGQEFTKVQYHVI